MSHQWGAKMSNMMTKPGSIQIPTGKPSWNGMRKPSWNGMKGIKHE